MTPLEIRQAIQEFFIAQPFGVLGTMREGLSHLSLVSFASTKDLKTLLIVTGRTSRKFQNILANPRVSFFTDNRPDSSLYIHAAMGISAKGQAYELDKRSESDSVRIYLEKHPAMEEFLKSLETVLIGIQVESYEVVTNFQELATVNMI